MIPGVVTHSDRGCIWQLSDWLFKGNQTAINNHLYEEYGISSIVRLNDNEDETIFPRPPATHLFCPFDDPGHTLTMGHLNRVRDYVISVRSKVLVHCFGGRNRSTLICAWLLHVVDGMPKEALVPYLTFPNCNAGIHPKLSARMMELTGIDLSGLEDGRVTI